MSTDKQWSPDDIKNLLDRNVEMIWRSILVMHRRQTIEEQNNHSTIHQNGVGWSGVDAKFGTSLADQLNPESDRNRGRTPQYIYLSWKQTKAAQKMLKKYARQLSEAATNGEYKTLTAANRFHKLSIDQLQYRMNNAGTVD